MSECERGWKIKSTSAFGCGILISNESTLSFLTVDEAEAKLNEHVALKRLLRKAEDVQKGKMEHPNTFCWWCGGLKHDMTKNAAFYCEGTALLTAEEQDDD